jgi:hypothetical protein
VRAAPGSGRSGSEGSGSGRSDSVNSSGARPGLRPDVGGQRGAEQGARRRVCQAQRAGLVGEQDAVGHHGQDALEEHVLRPRTAAPHLDVLGPPRGVLALVDDEPRHPGHRGERDPEDAVGGHPGAVLHAPHAAVGPDDGGERAHLAQDGHGAGRVSQRDPHAGHEHQPGDGVVADQERGEQAGEAEQDPHGVRSVGAVFEHEPAVVDDEQQAGGDAQRVADEDPHVPQDHPGDAVRGGRRAHHATGQEECGRRGPAQHDELDGVGGVPRRPVGGGVEPPPGRQDGDSDGHVDQAHPGGGSGGDAPAQQGHAECLALAGGGRRKQPARGPSGDRGQNRARVMTAWGKVAHIGVVP